MYIDIVESLRCPNAHDQSALVGVFATVDGRDVVEGVLGCPVCRAEYPIHEGVAWFGGVTATRVGPAAPASEEEAMRIAAFLNLTEANGFAVLHGRWAVHAPIVSGFSPTHLVLIDPAGDVARAPGITILRGSLVVRLAAGSAHAAAIDYPGSDDRGPEADRARELASALVEAVRPGGRLMAPIAMPIQADTRDLVRDERVWVAEREVQARVIPLTRRRET